MHTRSLRRDPVSDAIASLFLPGLGQWLQHRRVSALYFLVDVTATIAVGAIVPGLRTLAWLSVVVVTCWSAVDAAVAARRWRTTN